MTWLLRLQSDGRAEVGQRVGVVVAHGICLRAQTERLGRLGVRADEVAANFDRRRQFSIGRQLFRLAQRRLVGTGLFGAGLFGAGLLGLSVGRGSFRRLVIGRGLRSVRRVRPASA